MTATRTATTSTPLHPLLADRWSPRAFDPSARLTGLQVTALLEAARWAPSAANSQPWRFLLALRGSADFEHIFATLAPGNQAWAGAASALVMVAAATTDDAGSASPWALYDTGQAVAHLSTQASHEGLSVHQLGGFDKSAVVEAFGLDATLTPASYSPSVCAGHSAHDHGVRRRGPARPERLTTPDSMIVRTRRPLDRPVSGRIALTILVPPDEQRHRPHLERRPPVPSWEVGHVRIAGVRITVLRAGRHDARQWSVPDGCG